MIVTETMKNSQYWIVPTFYEEKIYILRGTDLHSTRKGPTLYSTEKGPTLYLSSLLTVSPELMRNGKCPSVFESA